MKDVISPNPGVFVDEPPPRRSRKGLVVLALIAVAVILVWGILSRRGHYAQLQRINAEEAVQAVQAIHPVAGPSARPLDLPGQVHAWFAAPIYAQVSGYVTHWYKDYGAKVKAGDLLATIDAPELDEQYASAQARLLVAQTQYRLAQVTARRWQALAHTQAVSQQQVDVQTANAAAEKAKVSAAEHDVARYQALESFKRVVAPFDGVVTSRKTDVGAYVNANGGAAGATGKSTELFSVADIHKMRVFVSVPQDYAAVLRPGLTATISLPQFPGRRFTATFDTSAHAVDPLSRTVTTELIVDNPDGIIWPGAYTSVHFMVPSNPDIVIVPEQSLLFRAHGMQVAIINPDHTVTLRNVKVGLNLGRTVQVIEGLKLGDLIVNNPSEGLIDGEKVDVVPGAPGIQPDVKFRAMPTKKSLSDAQKLKVEAAKGGDSE